MPTSTSRTPEGDLQDSADSTQRELGRLSAAVESLLSQQSHISQSLSELRSEISRRQSGQWPLMLSAVGVLIALGALVSAGFYRDIGRLEGHHIAMEVQNDDREKRLSGVAHNAASSVVGLGELKKTVEQMSRDMRSLEYRTTKGERP